MAWLRRDAGTVPEIVGPRIAGDASSGAEHRLESGRGSGVSSCAWEKAP
jgi:hypothetical protein